MLENNNIRSNGSEFLNDPSFSEELGEGTEEGVKAINFSNFEISYNKISMINEKNEFNPKKNMKLHKPRDDLVHHNKCSSNTIDQKDYSSIFETNINNLINILEKKVAIKKEYDVKRAELKMQNDLLKEGIENGQKNEKMIKKNINQQKVQQEKLLKERDNLELANKDASLIYQTNKNNIETIINALTSEEAALEDERIILQNELNKIKEACDNEKKRLKSSLKQIEMKNIESNKELEKARKILFVASQSEIDMEKIIQAKSKQIQTIMNREKNKEK